MLVCYRLLSRCASRGLGKMRFPDRSPFKNEQIAPRGFVFVPGELGLSGELLWMLPIRFRRFKEGVPGRIELDQDLIADLAR